MRIEEVPIPAPGPGEVLIKVVATGVCHTDLHAANGDWPGNPPAVRARACTVSLVGLPPGEFGTPIFDVVMNRVTIRGSIVGGREDLAEAIAFAAEGKVRAEIHKTNLDNIN